MSKTAIKNAILVAFVVLLGTMFATKCRASELAAEFGSSYVRGEAPALAVTLIFPKAGPGDADYQCGVVLSSPTTHHEEKQRNNAIVHCEIVDGFKRFDLGIGLAYGFGTDAYNGSHVNFSLSAAYNFNDRNALVLRHFSNLGRDFVLYQWGF